ncbi:MAG: hypothetical protein CM15mP92_0450 [Halieaceae bacterium]|nr:MAG: hypothetical protein CM15mP92_0450 [Halieaceae bacterium]
MERICTYALFEDKKSKENFMFLILILIILVSLLEKSAQLIIDYVNSLNENNFPVFITVILI